MTTRSQGKDIKMAHSKSLYSFRMAQKAEMIALCALINSVYRGDAAKDGWTTEADLLGGQRCDVAMLEKLSDKPDSGFLVATKEDEIIACCHVQLATATVAECGMLSVTPAWQNQGIAKALLRTAEQYSRETWQATRM
ncbi:GNAT family N-acetyltransferase, partial [Acidithiobacillus ferrooxidans]|nr:GNAT family N-acetyltransferase [Acidithiobacillus ferrooxidans]